MNRYLIYVDEIKEGVLNAEMEEASTIANRPGTVWRTYEVDAEDEAQAEQFLLESGEITENDKIRHPIQDVTKEWKEIQEQEA